MSDYIPAQSAQADDRRVTFANRLIITKNRPAGFDYMRICLALCVIFWHSFIISYGEITKGPFQRSVEPLIMLVVPMFFALSGFLVAGSLERSRTIFGFLGLRVFRIMPALSVEVLLSALILGPLLTNLPLGDYFSDSEFHRYFLNILGDIHYILPGVFVNHPMRQVNGQLWTVPYELVCYIILACIAVLGIFRQRHMLLGFLVLCYAAQIANTLFRPSTAFEGAGGSTIVMAFVAGLLLFRYREKIMWSGVLCLAMAAISILLPILVPKGMRFAPVPIAYVTVYLGLLNPQRNRIILSGDYSYGVFLYGFPIQQAVYSLGPQVHEWYYNMLITVPLTVAFAAFSWWFIEKPVLSQRNIIKRGEDWYLRHFKINGSQISLPYMANQSLESSSKESR